MRRSPAFVDKYKPDLLGWTVKFDLHLFMTGHDLWVHYETLLTFL